MPLNALDMDAWRAEALEAGRSGDRHRLGEFSSQIARRVIAARELGERSEGLWTKLRAAASMPWVAEGSAAPVLAYEQLVSLLAGTSMAGQLMEMGIEPGVDFDAPSHCPTRGVGRGVVLVVGGEKCWVPDEWLAMDGPDRVLALRQATTLVLIDHGMPRSGAIAGLVL